LLHPGRSAGVRVDGEPAGWLGELHPRLVRQFELPRAPVVFELDLAPLVRTPLPAARPVSKLPVVRRDFAVVVDDALPAAAVLDAVTGALAAPAVAVRLFDVYRGTGLPAGKKSLAILVLMQDTERTLTDAEIDATVAALVRTIIDKFGGSLRS
jgi:phenylalanyl-tRNA synthetase beta chain